MRIERKASKREREKSRDQEIECSFLNSSRIWPPHIPSDRSHRFTKALVEVLRRLPQRAYNTLERQIQFIVEDTEFKVLGVNVPFGKSYPPSSKGIPNPNGIDFRIDTIVIYARALALSHDALVGLIAHEIAHSFVSNPYDYKEDEKAVNSLAVKWGFKEELKALHPDKPPSGKGG